MNDLSEMGARLRDLRGNAEITQAELAELALVDVAAVGDMERGERVISYPHLRQFARVFGLSTDALDGLLRGGGGAARHAA
ncbi:MAG: helix-turn-helix transcriptional regulator [Alphaproteobacteria bacterium]